MDSYNHLVYAAIVGAAILICTKWYRIGLWIMLGIFLIDLYVRIFISFDLVHIIIAALAIPSIIRDMLNKEVTSMTRKLRLLSGCLFIILGALALAVLSYPYFLVAGIIITLFAYFHKK